MTRRRIRLAACAALCLCSAPALVLAVGARPAAAASNAEIEGVRFDETLQVEDTSLALAGLGLLRYRVLFRGYVAALYLPAGIEPADALADVPKRLEIEYFWPIDGDAIARAGDALVRRNVPDDVLAGLAPRLREIGSRYEDVEPGDRYSLTYLPGRGTTLAKNGRPITRVPGADFAAAYFSIWLGDDPIDGSLREQLLGGR